LTKYIKPYQEPKGKHWLLEEFAFWTLMLSIPGGLVGGLIGIVTSNWVLAVSGLASSMFSQCVVLHYRTK
jgi:hypothetical protein